MELKSHATRATPSFDLMASSLPWATPATIEIAHVGLAVLLMYTREKERALTTIDDIAMARPLADDPESTKYLSLVHMRSARLKF
jgi:hypothetical protein